MKGYSPKSLEIGDKVKSQPILELGFAEPCEMQEVCLKGGENCKCKKD